MIYKDKVYGPTKIKEKILIDLMKTKTMQRLKKINQGGPAIFLDPKHEWSKYKTTRFEHSVGVTILLKKLNATLEEQIAGLLHDVSHTVFSHAIDFLFNRYTKQDYHEKFHKKIILESQIPSILKKHGIDVEDILDKKKFTLLERELPDLCADRIDYFLRDMVLYFNLPKIEVEKVFSSILIFNNEIIFASKDTAKNFAEKYIEANNLLYCNPLQSSLFKFVSEVVRLGISKRIISKEDLFSTDDEVYNKLKKSKDKKIAQMLKLISNLKVVEDKSDYDMHLKSKVRYLDPKILFNGKIVRLSEVDSSYKMKMKEFIDNASKGFFVRILR